MKVFKKKKLVPPPKDQMNIKTYNYQKTLDPLKDKHSRPKNGGWSNRKEQRKEVKETLLPWMCDFVKSCLKWKKMPKYYRNDNRILLTQYFVGRYYSVINDKHIKRNIWYKPSENGKLIMDAIKKKQPGFTETELLDTLIFVMYKSRVDHYSMKLKDSDYTNPLKQENVSLWDKISENVQV